MIPRWNWKETSDEWLPRYFQRKIRRATRRLGWSSFRHYLTGESGVVEIESPWTEYYRATKGPAP